MADAAAGKDDLQDASTNDSQDTCLPGTRERGLASSEASLAAQLDDRFHVLRAAMETLFAEQAQQLEQVSLTQQGLLSECLHHLGTQRDALPPKRARAPPPQPWPSECEAITRSASASSCDQLRSSRPGCMPDSISVDSPHEDRGSALFLSHGEPVQEEVSRATSSRVVQQLMQMGSEEWDKHEDLDRSECSWWDSPRRKARSTRSETRSGWMTRVVLSPLFEQAVGGLIVANAVFIGLQVDWHSQHLMAEKAPWFLPASFLFTGCFLVELVLKLVVHRSEYFCGEDWRWNYFDMLVVLSGVLELVVELIHELSLATDIMYLRIMRIMKLVRVVRVVRVVLVFRELRIMLLSVVATIRSLVWTLISLFVLTFCAGVHITSAVADYQEREAEPYLATYFGSLSRTLLSLFQATSGGIDWRVLTDELEKVGALAVAVFIMYVCLVLYAVMNILTGVCVNQATHAADHDVECVMRDERARRDTATQTLRRFFHEADKDNTGTITWSQLCGRLSDLEVRAYFKTLGIEVWDLRIFFDVLKRPGSRDDGISIDQFVRGCLGIKGHAKSSDLMAMRLELDTIARMSSEMQEALNQVMEQLRTDLKQDELKTAQRTAPHWKDELKTAQRPAPHWKDELKTAQQPVPHWKDELKTAQRPAPHWKESVEL